LERSGHREKAWTLQYESANQSSKKRVHDCADSVRRISMPESTSLQTSMNMVSGLRHGVLLSDADVLVWRQVWPERDRTHEPVDARRLHLTNHIAEVTYVHRRVIKEQAPACAKTRSSEMRALRREETLAR
jgi:hypothetical protein